MGEWGNQRSWEEERGVAPAGRPMPAGETAAVPPPFLVYKRRLYVLARKPPVLDHRQASIDSIFGTAEEPVPKPALRVSRRARTGVAPQAAPKVLPSGHGPVQMDRESHRSDRPRFVPRDARAGLIT